MQAIKTASAQRCAARPALRFAPLPVRVARPLVVARAADADDLELEKRLEKLRLAKGATPYKQTTKASQPEPEKKPAGGKREYDFTGETVHYEGGPSAGDLAVNVALGITLLWLPLTIAAVGRAAFVKYKFTNRRLSVVTTAPWKNEQLDAAYQEIKDIKYVGRGVGLWGDVVVTLQDGSKIEIRSLEKYKELVKYMLDRRDELVGPAGIATPKGKILSQEELMGEAPATSSKKADRKGFA